MFPTISTEVESEVDKFFKKEDVIRHIAELVDEDFLKELTPEIATTDNQNAQMMKTKEEASNHASNYDDLHKKANQWHTTQAEEEIISHETIPENTQDKTAIARHNELELNSAQKEWLGLKDKCHLTYIREPNWLLDKDEKTSESEKNLEKRKKNDKNIKLKRMNLRKSNQAYLKNIYACKICLSIEKNFVGCRKKDLKEHITNDHKPITPQDYKSIFEKTETNIMRRWKRKDDTKITRRSIRLLMGKVRSYTNLLLDELRGVEMTSNEITPALKLEFVQEAIPLEMLSRLLKIYAY